jgi:CIC family chloride channel protein
MGQIFRRIRLSQQAVLITLAVLVGLSTAVAVFIFRVTFHFFNYLFFDVIGERGFLGQQLEALGIYPQISTLILLVLAGLLVGFIAERFIGHEKHHGAAGIMEAVALAGGRLRYTVAPFKALAAAISLGAGASLGLEDPSVQIGANLGSFFGAKLHLTEEQVKVLVASGGASAIASAFNAPIAGVFFALEIILGEFTTGLFGVVVLAAVVAAAASQGLVGGTSPVFGDLDYVLGNSAVQLPFYALLGLILAFLSSLLIRTFHWQSDFWHHQIKLPVPIKTAIAGFIVGIVGLFLPQILGPGEEFMHAILTGHTHVAIYLLIIIGFVKLFMTAISAGGGFFGGSAFAPVLFIGIVFGNAYGQLIDRFIPSVEVGNPQAYAIAGMAGLLAGVVRAPITAIMMVFELTDDYNLILPIMLTSVTCVLVVERIGPAGIYMWALMKQGLHLHRGRDVDVMQGIEVQEAMLKPAPTILESATLPQLRDAFHQQHTRALVVVDENQHLTGMVTLGDLQRAYEDSLKNTDIRLEDLTVGDVCSRDVKVARPKDVLWTAIRNMGAHDIGRLPVVDTATDKVIGMIRRHDIMNAYNQAIARKFKDQHYAEQIRLNTLTGAHVLEFDVRSGCQLIDKQIRDVQFPPDAVVASILRQGKLIVPHGDTFIRKDDKVTLVADHDAELLLKHIFNAV